MACFGKSWGREFTAYQHFAPRAALQLLQRTSPWAEHSADDVESRI